MSHTREARTKTRRTLGRTGVGLVVVTAAIIGTLVYPSASSSAPSFGDVPRGDHGGATTEDDGAITEDDGALPDSVTVFDDEYPGVANLDPDLLQALRDASTDAADDGIELNVNSGWRSLEYQNQLLREAVSRYGSERKLPDGSPPRTPPLTCPGTRSTSGLSMPRPGCPTTAPSTGCARSTATNPGTTNCAPRRSIVVALPCMPTPRTIRACSGDRRFRPILSRPR